MNKKGFSTLQIISFIVVSFILIVFLGFALWGSDLINDNLGINAQIGQVNLQNITNQTYGQFNSAFMNSADDIGLIILFGMCLSMIGAGYYSYSKQSKAWIFVDIIILVIAFIFATYVSALYSTLINSSLLFTFFETDLPNSSSFILNLPLIVGILGGLIMLVTYAGIKQYTDTSTNVLGYG